MAMQQPQEGILNPPGLQSPLQLLVERLGTERAQGEKGMVSIVGGYLLEDARPLPLTQLVAQFLVHRLMILQIEPRLMVRGGLNLILRIQKGSQRVKLGECDGERRGDLLRALKPPSGPN